MPTIREKAKAIYSKPIFFKSNLKLYAKSRKLIAKGWGFRNLRFILHPLIFILFLLFLIANETLSYCGNSITSILFYFLTIHISIYPHISQPNIQKTKKPKN
jgi:hypothetical protein